MNWNTTGLFDLSHTLAGDYLARFTYPWQALDGIKELILSLGPALGEGCPHVALIAQNAVPHVVVMGRLHPVEEDDVFQKEK